MRVHRMLVSATTAAILIAGLITAVPALAAVPKGKAVPATNLSDAKIVKVSGTGWPASDSLVIVECNANAATSDQNACDQTRIVSVTASAKGVVAPTAFTFKAGAIGDGTCNPGQTCYLTLTEPSATGSHALIKVTVSKTVNGAIACTLGTSAVTFTPPLVASGTKRPDKANIASTTLSACTSSTGGAPSSGTITTKTIVTPAAKGGNLCSAFLANAATTKFQFTVKWNNGAATSVAKFTGASPSGTGFSLSGGKVTGSFATPNTATATVKANASDLVNLLNCGNIGNPTSVASLGVTGGGVSF